MGLTHQLSALTLAASFGGGMSTIRFLNWLRSHWHAFCWRTFRIGWSWAFHLRCHQRRHWHIPCQRCWCSLPRDLPKINAFSRFGRIR